MVIYKEGSAFSFDFEHDGVIEKNHKFILKGSVDSDFIFQILCVDGFHKGTVEGYVKKEIGVENGTTKDHLKNELNRNFIKIHWDTFNDK
jgi:hypothetical protein